MMPPLRKFAAEISFVILFLPLWLLALIAMFVAICLDGCLQALSSLFGKQEGKAAPPNENDVTGLAGRAGAQQGQTAQPGHDEKVKGRIGAEQGPNRIGSRH